MSWLKQGTAATVKIGPFVDETDGKTAETGLTIAQADVRLAKNGGDMAQKNSAAACTHDEIGVYDCPLSTTDTNTLGRLDVFIHKSGALAVFQSYLVLPANVYDALVSGSDYLQVDLAQVSDDTAAADALETMLDGTGGNKLHLAQLNIVALGNDDAIVATGSGTGHGINATGGATDAAGIHAEGGGEGAGMLLEGGDTGNGLELVGAVGLYALASDALPAIALANVDEAGNLITGNGAAIGGGGGAGGDVNVAQVDGSTTAAQNLRKWYDGTGYNAAASAVGTAASVTNTVAANLTTIGGNATLMTRLTYLLEAATSSTAKAGTLTTTVFTTNLTETTNDHYKGLALKWASGTMKGQITFVAGYNGSTKALTVSPAMTEAPAAGDVFILL